MPRTLSPADNTEQQERITPKSALRHRPLGPVSSPMLAPRVARASRTQVMPRPTAKQERTSSPPPVTTTSDELPPWQRVHPPVSLWHSRRLVPGAAFGMLLAVGFILLGQIALSWFNTLWDDIYYGYPRTSQINAVVGHHDSAAYPSHFIALNFNGQIEVIEFPGGDASHAVIYIGPHLTGPHADLVPVTLQFVDVRHDQQPDMVVLVSGEQFIYRNMNGQFHAPATGSV